MKPIKIEKPFSCIVGEKKLFTLFCCHFFSLSSKRIIVIDFMFLGINISGTLLRGHSG